MRSFRRAVRRSRWLVVLVLLCTFSHSVEASNYASTYRVAREEEKRLAEMAKRLGVPVEKLRREQPGLVESVRNLFTDEEAEARKAGQARVEAQLKKMAEQVAANPYRSQVEEVKNAYQSHRLDGLLRDLTQLSTTEVASLPVASRKALLRNIQKSLKEDLEPHVPDNLPPKARGKHNQLRGRLHALYGKLRRILDDPDALSDPKLAQTLGKIAAEVNDEVHRPQRGPRFADRPLPLQLREQTVRTEEVTQPVGAPSSAMVVSRSTTPPAARRTAAAAVAPEIAALAQSLGNSPARIFAHVHDNVRFDPKWGAMRSPPGTLQETEGTSWDQAWLLMELLTAAGVEAKVEWGQIEIPASLLLTLTGTSDPFDAGNLLSTGGVPAVLLVQAGQVVGARLGHVWVKAHIDYIPDRGVKPGTPDAWVRMDPSFKRYGFAAGIDVHSQVPFDLGNYLQSGTEQSPRRAYEDALWAYIRANNIDCVNLEQLKKAAQVVRERFPYIPGTLRGKILRVDGEQAAVPESFQQRLTLEVKTAAGGSLISWSTPAPAVYGKRVEIDYLGATADDQVTLDAYGGVFETPPYLVDLKPVVRVAGAPMAQGGEIGSAADTEVWVTMTAPTGPPTIVTHETSAGERHVLTVDFGEIPQTVLDAHQTALNAARAAGNASEEEAETLFLIGAQYLHNLGRDLTDLSGWKWQRLVRLGTEGLISQSGIVTTTVGGAPISFRRGERNVDVALMPLGMVPADGRRQFRREAFELLGAQSSFLEGEVFTQVLQREGIASVSALTLSKRSGQTLTRVDSANMDTVLGQVDLGADAEAEVRSAVSRGRIAWVAQSRVTVRRWTGTGYVLEDPSTGAAGYLISGGFAGGAEVDPETKQFFFDLLGGESWLGGSPLGKLLNLLLGGPEGEDDPSTQQSDPINLATGNLWRVELDLTIQARGIPIAWARTYNSRSTQDGPLGHGWSFTYGERLEERVDGSVVYKEADGSQHVFALSPEGYESPPGKHLTLWKLADGFSLTTKTGMVSRFTGTGKITSITDRNGNTVTLDYDTEGNLQNVTDAAGRVVLTTSVIDGRIVQISDHTGRSVQYTYSGADLVGVLDTMGKPWSYAYDEAHNLVLMSDPLGNENTYAYDSLDRCYSHVDPLGHIETFAYSSRGERGVVTDRRGYDTYLEFDESGRALLSVDALGNASRAEWDADNNRTMTIDPRGGMTTRTFDVKGNVLSERDPIDQSTSYTYDPVYNHVLTKTDPSGHTITNSYDAGGNLVRVSQAVGGTEVVDEYEYDPFGQITRQIDARGNTLDFTWDDTKGTLDAQTDALGQTTVLTTDELGRVINFRDPSNESFQLQWDARSRPVLIEDPFANRTEILYDAAGRQSSIRNTRGTTTLIHDAVGQLIQTVDPLGNLTRTEYDQMGNATVRVDAKGNRSTVAYDAIGRPMLMIDALGHTWSYGYCAELGGGVGAGCGAGGCSGAGSGSVGDFCELTDPKGHVFRQDYDALGRVVRVTDPVGNVTRLTFDELGRTTEVIDALNRTTKYVYDAVGRLTSILEANGARTVHTYDAIGNILTTQDAEGRTWSRTYDALNRVKSETDPLGHQTVYSYDSVGNLKTQLDPKGQLIQFEYDHRRLTAVVLPDGSQETFGYDALGRRTSMANADVSLSYSLDALGRITRATNQTLNREVAYSYDPNGNLVNVTSPEGLVSYFYDQSNRLIEQRDSVTGTYRYEYDELNRRTALLYPNGFVTGYEYDASGRLTSIVTQDAQEQVVDGYSYTYDPIGNRSDLRSMHDHVVQVYQYDEVNRLVRWSRGESRFEEYAYDRVGNRTRRTDETGFTTYSYDQANRLLQEFRQFTAGGSQETVYDWDENGNLLTKRQGVSATAYQWDPLNRLRRISNAAGTYVYGYDPEGMRVREEHGGKVRQFFYAMEDVVSVYGAGGSREAYYAHGPGIDEPLAQVASEGLQYLHRDGMGSVTALSGAAGESLGRINYSVFGSVESATGAKSRYGFTGRELDDTGLSYYRARYYQPEVGRFVSRDSFGGRPTTPASSNRFIYVMNNPTRYTDPSGHEAMVLSAPDVLGLQAATAALVSAIGAGLAALGAIAVPTAVAAIAIAVLIALVIWLLVLAIEIIILEIQTIIITNRTKVIPFPQPKPKSVPPPPPPPPVICKLVAGPFIQPPGEVFCKYICPPSPGRFATEFPLVIKKPEGLGCPPTYVLPVG